MFEKQRLGFERWRDTRRSQKDQRRRLTVEQRDERFRLSEYHCGFHARTSGRPRIPPGFTQWGYPANVAGGVENEASYQMRYQAWTAGWDAADEQMSEHPDQGGDDNA
jgi:hypothetical protein